MMNKLESLNDEQIGKNLLFLCDVGAETLLKLERTFKYSAVNSK